jgi:membrane fusion protein, copper/silver efflux system
MARKFLTVGLVGALAFGLAGYALYRAGVTAGRSLTISGQQAPREPLFAGRADGASLNLQQLPGVWVADVTRGRLKADTTVSATVVCDERDVAFVHAPVSGLVEHLRVRAQHDTVQQGEALADLYVHDWFATQMEYLVARDLRRAGPADIAQDARQRLHRAGMPEDLIRALDQTGRPQARLTVLAPLSGIVTDLNVRVGMKVTTGAPLMRINGLSTVWVTAEVSETLGQALRSGDAVTARTTAVPDAVFAGTVGTVLPNANLTTHTLTARVALENPQMQLLPGMPVTLQFASGAGADVLLVPSDAVISTGTRRVVMLSEDDGRFRPVSVETGSQADGLTEIRSGLMLGQKVLLSGAHLPT